MSTTVLFHQLWVNPKAQELYDALSALVSLKNLPITLVFGGDGFMLESIRNQRAKGVFLGFTVK